ncbi:hypothetical protein D3C81_1475330 [compost metagenome]
MWVVATSVVSTPNTINEISSALRLPWLSEYQPVVILLNPIPSKVAEASMPASLKVRPRSCRITGSAMVSRMISIASNRYARKPPTSTCHLEMDFIVCLSLLLLFCQPD